jgi:hypothetical protein
MSQGSFFDANQYVRPFAAPPVLHQPPRLHWGWVLALSAVTLGVFGMIWLLVQARWAKRVRGHGRAFWWALAYLLYIPGAFVLGGIVGLICAAAHVPFSQVSGALQLIVRAAGYGIYIWTIFTLRSELASSPINLPLGGIMTFFFGPIYFQYHLYDYGELGGSEVVGLGLSSFPATPPVEPMSSVDLNP